MMQKRILLAIGVIALWGNSAAQQLPAVTFDGQIRMRSEADGRDFNNDSDLNTYTLLRTRFGATVRPREDITAYIQIQDSRAFGQEPNTLANTTNLDISTRFFSKSERRGINQFK